MSPETPTNWQQHAFGLVWGSSFICLIVAIIFGRWAEAGVLFLIACASALGHACCELDKPNSDCGP